MLQLMGEMLEPGLVFGTQYRLERQLGAGGMGAVWAAVDRASGTTVALKVLHPDRVGDEKDRARFLREARLAMAVRHPNIAAVHAVAETESGTPFLVMDLLEGESFRTLLQRRVRLEAEACARVFTGIVAGVGAAHAMGIVHRDLKPENVFILGPKGAAPDAARVRVLDFGVAKRMPRTLDATTASASLTSTGAVVGTPRYMAPEQIFGAADLDARADIWALGVMLFEALAGTRPTDGGGFGEILRRITVDPLPTLRSVRPELPAALDLVDRMLSRPREQRPSLDRVATMLAKIERGEDDAPATRRLTGERVSPAVAAPALELAPTRVAPLVPPRRRSFVALGSLGIVLLCAGGVAFAKLARQPSAAAAVTVPAASTTSARTSLTPAPSASAAPLVWAPPPTTGRLRGVTYERAVERLNAAGWKQEGQEVLSGWAEFLVRSAIFKRDDVILTITFYLTSTDWAQWYVGEKAAPGRRETFVEDAPLFLSVVATGLVEGAYDRKESKHALEIILRP